MDDLISRQAAIDAVRKCQVKEVTPAYMLIDKAGVMTELMMLSSAQPKTGKWTKISPALIYECSECRQHVLTTDIDAYKFCHGCGCRMLKEGE